MATQTALPEDTNSPEDASASASRQRSYRWLAVFLVACLLMLGFVIRARFWHSKAGKSPPKPPAVMIGTATVQTGNIGIYVDALGVVTPVNTVAVRSRVDGQLVKVHYTEGKPVHEGDPLADIDPAPFQAALTQAEGQLARDKALLENARVDLERYKEAFAKNAIQKQLLDTQLATVSQYEGVVKLDEGQLENARVQLSYCHITAPITGRVGLRLVDRGNIVHATDTNPIVIITQLEPIAVIFSVAEDYLPEIQQQFRNGKELTVDALDRAQQRKIATGTLQTLDNQIDTTTGTLKLKALFPNEDGALFPNQFVNARLLVDTHRDVACCQPPPFSATPKARLYICCKPIRQLQSIPLLSKRPKVMSQKFKGWQ
jgi:multidrug efflux system membrane fusion protein